MSTKQNTKLHDIFWLPLCLGAQCILSQLPLHVVRHIVDGAFTSVCMVSVWLEAAIRKAPRTDAKVQPMKQ